MRVFALLLCTALASCTPGAPSAGGGSTGPASTTIDVSLTSSVVSSTPYGSSGGFSPAITSVPVGASIRFVNVDSFDHTSTAISGTSFPSSSPFDATAQLMSGATLSGGWSTGTLGAGNGSQILLADKAGTYLYGCFFHYSAPMRGAIVVH
ncbi:MAG TPA: plastocyanin/azurin family copper-binding protein [Candidatus Elarobacter sp.]|nr:plastocyanin/azurin family copper-binding protein [Candidatus Elarobacter sp.]